GDEVFDLLVRELRVRVAAPVRIFVGVTDDLTALIDRDVETRKTPPDGGRLAIDLAQQSTVPCRALPLEPNMHLRSEHGLHDAHAEVSHRVFELLNRGQDIEFSSCERRR